jgi:predicted nuclease of predicted toxin-antitoxin system
LKFLVDEDVAIELDRCLRQDGHEVVRTAQTLGFRTDDADIWDHACRHRLIVLTCNRQDFLELAGDAPATGLIILNRRRSRQAECAHLRQLIQSAGETGIYGNINFA